MLDVDETKSRRIGRAGNHVGTGANIPWSIKTPEILACIGKSWRNMVLSENLHHIIPQDSAPSNLKSILK
jgi:hypothetical protein